MKTRRKKMIGAVVKFQNYNEEYRDFRSLMLLLDKNGYSSLVISPLQQILNSLSTHLPVDPSKMDFLGDSSGEILMKEQPEIFFFIDESREFAVTEEGEIISPNTLEICCLAPDEKTGRSEIKKIAETIENTAKIPLVSPPAWMSKAQQEGEEKNLEISQGALNQWEASC